MISLLPNQLIELIFSLRTPYYVEGNTNVKTGKHPSKGFQDCIRETLYKACSFLEWNESLQPQAFCILCIQNSAWMLDFFVCIFRYKLYTGYVASAFFLLVLVFHKYYHGPRLVNSSAVELHLLADELQQPANHSTATSLPAVLILCTRERPILCLLLMLGTLWLGYALFLIKRR